MCRFLHSNSRDRAAVPVSGRIRGSVGSIVRKLILIAVTGLIHVVPLVAGQHLSGLYGRAGVLWDIDKAEGRCMFIAKNIGVSDLSVEIEVLRSLVFDSLVESHRGCVSNLHNRCALRTNCSLRAKTKYRDHVGSWSIHRSIGNSVGESFGDVKSWGLTRILKNHVQLKRLVGSKSHYVGFLLGNPGSLIDVHRFYANTGQNDIDDYGGTDEDSHNYFADSRGRTLCLSFVWLGLSLIGSCCGVWFLAVGIHDRLPRKIGFALALFLFSVLATCHGTTLLIGI